MTTLEKAISLAAQAHVGQVDKAGEPYILHCLRVMQSVSPRARIAAVLHDIVEDTHVTLANLEAMGFSAEDVSAVDALTKRKGETRMQAAERAARNLIALEVKLADNADNSNASRLGYLTEKDVARMKEYEQVREYLLEQCRLYRVEPMSA